MCESCSTSYKSHSAELEVSDVTVYVCLSPEDEVRDRGIEKTRPALVLQSLKGFATAPSRRAISMDCKAAVPAVTWRLKKPLSPVLPPTPSSSPTEAHIAPLARRPPPQRQGRLRDDTPLRLGVIVREAMFAQGRVQGVAVPDIHPEKLVERLSEERRELRKEQERERELELRRRRSRRAKTASTSREKLSKMAQSVLRLAAQGRANKARAASFSSLR